MNKETGSNSEPHPLLDNLLPDSSASSNEQGTFSKTLEDMEMTSVFDIVRLSKTEFKTRSKRSTDAGAAYDSAMSYAVQIGRAFREEMLGKGAQPSSAVSPIVSRPSHAELFPLKGEQFCNAGALEAMDSPVAYLSSLYRLATSEIENQGDGTEPKIKLDERRPDIRELVIDHRSVYTAVSMLEIVNDTLTRAISQDRLAQGQADTPIHNLLRSRRHPFMFPYNFSHHQAMLGLAGRDKPKAGELNYLISDSLPIRSDGVSRYGVTAPAVANAESTLTALTSGSRPANAQCLMTELSPEQQQIVIEPSRFAGIDTAEVPTLDDDQKAFFLNYYGIEVANSKLAELSRLEVFAAQTEIAAKDIQALLAQGAHAPRISENVVFPGAKNAESDVAFEAYFGAAYVNGAITTKSSDIYSASISRPLRLAKVTRGSDIEWMLTHTSPDRFDRLQRMIRLHRWTRMSYGELDTLIMAVIRAEGARNANGALTVNFLRSLGVYRYLSQRYRIELDEFAGLLHELSAFSSTDQAPMFDRVFNVSAVFGAPLVLDSSTLDVRESLEESQPLAQLCSGLKVQPGSASLALMAEQTSRALGGRLQYDLPTVSSLYRQARVAQLFGLSIEESFAALEMLGGEGYTATVARGGLRSPDQSSTADAGADLLDILMQMDWLVTWLAKTGQTVDALRRMLAVDQIEPGFELAAHSMIERSRAAMNKACDDARDLSALRLPRTTSDGSTLDWPGQVLAYCMSPNGVILDLPLPSPSSFEEWVDKQINEAFSAIQLKKAPAQDSVFKQSLIPHLTQHLVSAQAVQRQCVYELFRTLSPLEPERLEVAMRRSGDSFATLTEAICAPERAGVAAKIVHLAIRQGELLESLGLNMPALNAFVNNPRWLDVSAGDEPQPLTFSGIYLLTEYQRWVQAGNKPEQDVLAYFAMANAPAADPVVHSKKCSTLLAGLLDWDLTSLADAVVFLSAGIAKSMDQVDWVRRVQRVCQTSGLNIKTVMATARLDAADTSENAGWRAVGEAIVSSAR